MGGVFCPPETFKDNVKRHLTLGLEEVLPQPARSEPLYIACAGPSLRDTAHELEGKKYVWALNAAHDYLLKRGITPSHGVTMAPEDGILGCFQTPSPSTTYLVASQANPEVLDRLRARGNRVMLWHAHCPPEWGVDFGDRDYLTYGGGTVGLRSLDLAWMCGFRELHLLGFDACVSDDGRIGPETPLYPSKRALLRTFTVGGRGFRSLPAYARQVEDFGVTIRPLTGLKITFYGDGLMQWAVKETQTHAL